MPPARVLFLSSCSFPPTSLTCLVSLASFVSWMNAAPRRAAWGKGEGSLLSCEALLRGDLFSQPLAPRLDSDSEGTRIWLPITWERGPLSDPSPVVSQQPDSAHPNSSLYMASSASRQTLHNVQTDWQPKSSSFVLGCIHLAMRKLWCPPEAENGTERWDGPKNVGLEEGSEGVLPHTAPPLQYV